MNPYINPYGFTPEQDEAARRIAIARGISYHEVASMVLNLMAPTRQAVKAMNRLGLTLNASIPRYVGPRRDARRAHRKRLKRQR